MSEDLTDEDYAALAAASFRALDEEEDKPSESDREAVRRAGT